MNLIHSTDYVHNRLSAKKTRNTQQSTCSYHKLSPRDILHNLYNTINNHTKQQSLMCVTRSKRPKLSNTGTPEQQ